MSNKRNKNARKGKVMRESHGHRQANLMKRRRNPAFRAQEKSIREETILATDYLEQVVNGNDLDAFFDDPDRQVILGRMGSMSENAARDAEEAARKEKADAERRRRRNGYPSDLTDAMESVEGDDSVAEDTEEKKATVSSRKGIPELHEFMFTLLDALKEDYKDRLDERGFVTIEALTPDAVEFVFLSEDEKAKAIDG